jgi:putative nucleotidyltransferase-like protein
MAEALATLSSFREITGEDATPAMSPEDKLCLLLARRRLSPELQTRILKYLASPPQWPMILDRAYAHQVYPLLYRNLWRLGFPGVPPAVQTELKSAYLANALRNQLFAEELARLLKFLGEAGIPVIPLKGVALAQSLYGDPAARVCSDIDILVPPAKVAQAIDLIPASGYRSDFNDSFFLKVVRRHGRHYDAVREDRGISFLLELHWKLVQHSSRDRDAVRDLWAGARPQSFFGVPAFSLTPEWELLYLCIHATDHEWRSLKWLVDVHEIASSGRVDWQSVMRKAEEFEVDLAVRQTLAASSYLLGTRLPAYFSSVSLPEGVRLFPYLRVPAEDAQNAFAFRHLRLLKRPWDKLRYFATVVFAPQLTDCDFLRLPPALGFLYYVIRPLRLAWKWGWQFVQAGYGRLGSKNPGTIVRP